MQIRKMTISDYNQVYELWLSCKGMGLNDIDDSEAGIARFLKHNPSTCFVAEEDSRIIGVIMTGSDGRRGHIYHTAVHPDFRKRNTGRALVEKALSALKEEGISKVTLVVFSHNSDGNRFWEKLGFAERTDLTYRDIALRELERIDT